MCRSFFLYKLCMNETVFKRQAKTKDWGYFRKSSYAMYKVSMAEVLF